MATPAGIETFERRHALRLPAVVQQYYRSPRLICLLQAAWSKLNTDVFLEDLNDEALPPVRIWKGAPYLVIGQFPHSDTECGAELDGDDPYMYWEGVFNDLQPRVKFADWIYGLAKYLLEDEK